MPPFSERTAWSRSVQTPLREFLRPRPAARRAARRGDRRALVWVNVDASSYDSFWDTTLSIELGGRGISLDAARVGQQRPDDVLLLRRRARGAARVRPRGAARAAPLRPAAAGGDRRHGGRGGDLPALQRRAARPRTAGGSRCRPTRPSRSACSRSSAALPRPAARVHADRSSSSTTSSPSSSSRPSTRETSEVAPLLVAAGFFAAAVLVARASARCAGLVYLVLGSRRSGSRCSSRASSRS